jgi:hypothetical protein
MSNVLKSQQICVTTYFLIALITISGCSKKSETELRKEKDSIEQARYDEIIREFGYIIIYTQRNSTDIYGTGILIGDSLESYHRVTAYRATIQKCGTRRHSSN